MIKRSSVVINPDGHFNKIENIKDTKITKNNIGDVLLSLDPKDITMSFLMSIFGEFNGKSLCNPYDVLIVPTGHYHNNKNKFTTTVGLWIFNILFIESNNLFDELGYVNETISKKGFGKLNQKLSYALIEDRITTDQLSRFLETTQFTMPLETVLTPNHSQEMLTCSNKISKKKDELFKKYKKEIDEGNVVIVEKIEKELLDYAKELLGDDPALDTFISGSQGTFDNHFKNIYIMKGATRNPDPNAPKQYNIIKSNYIDGISAEDYSNTANSLAAGPYARGKKTATGGYWEKLMVSAYQHLVAGPKDSDCGTKNYITVDLTNDNVRFWMYSYIISGSSLIELTSQNMDKYIGKTVKFRFSSMCKSKDCICNKCLGNYFYRIEKKNVGVLLAQIAAKLKLISMKSFHDSVVRTSEMDPMKAFSIK